MEYINIKTGEIITAKNWVVAFLYYYKDSKKYKYSFKLKDIIKYSKY